LCYSGICWLAEVVIIEKLFQKVFLKFHLFFSVSSNRPDQPWISRSFKGLAGL
jgi:hypothetical protein